MPLHVDSEVGRLHQVIVHRPDLELQRLTPSNMQDFLFDDVLWVKEAKKEHDGFAEALRDAGVTVHYFDHLLRETVEIPEARQFILDGILDDRVYGPMAVDGLRDAIFGIVPNSVLADQSASYSVAADTIVGGTWAGNLVAAAVVISGIGALNGWTMVCAEMPRAAAEDGLFPPRFAAMSRRGVPAFSIVTASVAASVATVISFLGSDGATIFTTLVLMTGITAAIPYAFSALAQIVIRVRDQQTMHTPRFVRDVVVAVLALVFSLAFIYYSRNSGTDWYVVWGPFLMTLAALLVGIPVYLTERARMTPPPPVAPYQEGPS